MNNADNPASYTIETATITLKDPTREGYNFEGWTSDGGAITEIARGNIDNRTLTAAWKETKPVIPQTSYTLTAYKGQAEHLNLEHQEVIFAL